ncbi:MAG: Hpy99I family type II restriction endonuclease [Parcubacteria group bacterium]|nr:Hpy99I family type II restriction endonuclease [Parcubacteria group bacterium]
MTQFTGTIVVAIENVRLSNGVSVEKGDVGIVKSESGEGVVVFFIRIWEAVTIPKNTIKILNVERVGDDFSKKICNVCHKLLPTEIFAKNQNAKNNRTVRRPTCQTCRKQLEGINVAPKMRKEWFAKRPNRVPFDCPICAKRTIAGVTCDIVLDHNHKTGEVRGWICDSCNTGIGRFKDDIELLKRAMKFLG